MTKANYDHQICAGGTKKTSLRAQFPEAAVIVKNSSTITALALGSMLKGTMGCGISGRTWNRICQVPRNERGEEESETYRRLADYLEQLKATSGGTITDCQVNYVHVGGMRSLRVIGWPWSKLIAHTVRYVYYNLNTRRKI